MGLLYDSSLMADEDCYELLLHDPDLDLGRLTGANLAVAQEHGSLLAKGLTSDLAGAAAKARLTVLTKPIAGIRDRLPSGTPLLDLTRLGEPPATS